MSTKHIKNIRLFFIVFSIIWGILLIFIINDTELTSSPKFIEQSRLTVNIKTDILVKALSTRAADWCSYDDAILGDFTIGSNNKSSKIARVFLADSIAAKTARNYPHLFQFTEDEDKVSFKMKKYSFDGYVVVPVWLLEALLKNDILITGKDE